MKRLDAERLALWRSFRHTAAALDADLALALREHNLELAMYEVLSMLDAEGGRARMIDIANALVIERSTFTRVIDRMGAKGLVTRELTDADGRGVMAVITRKGTRAFMRARPSYRRVVQRSFAHHLTESDVVALHRVLNKVTE